jgi:hypothetical protein
LRFENNVVWKNINAISEAITCYYEAWKKENEKRIIPPPLPILPGGGELKA